MNWFSDLIEDVVIGLKVARRQRAQRKRVRDEEAKLSKLKAKVMAIGEIVILPDDSVQLMEGWAFEPPPGCPAVRIGLDGLMYYMGYNAYELKEIHAHRRDWV
jgi:hypothetical protein